MKIAFNILLLLALCASTNALATCRSGSAAQQGGQIGLNRDQQAALTLAQNEKSSSDILGKCISSITSVITAPQFPSLQSIFEQIENNICKIASAEVNGVVSSVNSQITGEMRNITAPITGSVNSIGTGQSVQMPPISSPQTPSAQPAQSSQFWSSIWK